MSMDILLSKLQSLIDYFHDEYEQGNVKYDSGFNDIVDKIRAELDECYVELPKDRDGEPIHVGDLLVFHYEAPENPYEVQCISYDGDGWHLYTHEGYFSVAGLTHYREPTPEDLLREFAEKIIDSQIPGVHPTYEEAIAEYAKRLRLAEGESE